MAKIPVGSTTFVRRRRDRRTLRYLLLAFLLLALAGLWLIWPYWELSGGLDRPPEKHPSRLYARVVRLETGQAIAAEEIVRRLEACGYRAAPPEGLYPGTYRAVPGQVAVLQRRFATAHGMAGGGLLAIDLDGASHIVRLRAGEQNVRAALLEPRLLASFYGPELLDLDPVPLAEVPREMVQSLLAAEDSGFFEHPGISATGIARALLSNLRGGEVRQGGSTLTQQLVKNRFLTPERTVKRKLREALLALFVEVRYEKTQILEAYFNEIFWGKPGSVNLIGLGAASRAYFDKLPIELSLPEAALLAGIIRSPAELSPYRHPEAALARRNQVLERLAELKWATSERVAEAKATPLGVVASGYGKNRAPYFAELAAQEAKRRFGVTNLADAGLTLISTLDSEDQLAAETAVESGLAALEERMRQKRGGPLESALVSLDPKSGAIRAYVGGRDFRVSQFDHAGQARRQAGSAFKPVVYAAAFAAGHASPATFLEDAPLTLNLAGKEWSPDNDDDSFRGWVTARQAVEESLNLPTVRLALDLGLPPIVELAGRMGVSSRLAPVPALALGAFELSPLELATVYSTLAGGGVRPPVHALDAVLDGHRQALAGEALPAPERVLSPAATYLVTSILQGVVAHGTAGRTRELGLDDPLAGKTGTTNSRRDAWFAGFAPTRVGLVWVGYDDNRPTTFSGSRAALPIWVDFMKRVRPPDGYPGFVMPEGVMRATIDPQSGGLALASCPTQMDEVFLAERAPTVACPLHGGPSLPGSRLDRVGDDPTRAPDGNAFVRWLRRVFGKDEPPPAPTPRR